MGNAAEYLGGISNLVGLERFITHDLMLKREKPLGIFRPKPDLLVVVHHYMLTQSGRPDEYRQIAAGIDFAIASGDNSPFTYHSQTNPFDIPKDANGHRLPYHGDTNYVFVVGFYGPDCVREQLELLLWQGFRTVQLESLIAGKVAKTDTSLVL